MRKICFILFLILVVIISMSSVSYAFREIARGSFMEAHTESVTVLESNESTLSEFSKLNIPKLEIVDGFDYAKERLVLVVAFACPDSGYSIVIETVDIKDGKTNVNYKTERGPEGKMYAQVISYPWLLAAVER